MKLVNLSLKQLLMDAKLETGKGVQKIWLNGRGHYGSEGPRWVVAPSDYKKKKKGKKEKKLSVNENTCLRRCQYVLRVV
jgi:hypothetical protein